MTEKHVRLTDGDKTSKLKFRPESRAEPQNMDFGRLVRAVPGTCCSLLFALGRAQGWALSGPRPIHALAVLASPAVFLFTTRDEVYNILWVLVFGFATINILSLGARRFEAHKRGLNFGEVLAILIVVISIVLLAWEMLYVFHILPIRLSSR
jgi:hypothetical protein